MTGRLKSCGDPSGLFADETTAPVLDPGRGRTKTGQLRAYARDAASSPVATEILRGIAMLYAIEDEVRGCTAEQRRVQRIECSRIIVKDLRLYVDARLRQISAKSKLAEAIRYATNRWDGLVRFIDDGRIELDTNTVERSIRPWP